MRSGFFALFPRRRASAATTPSRPTCSSSSVLVPADCVAYSELDRVQRRVRLVFGRPEDEDDSVKIDDEVRWRVLLEEHPLCVHQQEGHFGAMKLSDLLTQRELHRTWVYDNWFVRFDIEHELEVSIPSPLWHTKTFLFDRSGGRDFTERDRLCS